MLSTISIHSGNADNPDLRRLYETAFPVEEQIPYNDLFYLLDALDIDYTAYYDGELLVGLRFDYPYKKPNPFKRLRSKQHHITLDIQETPKQTSNYCKSYNQMQTKSGHYTFQFKKIVNNPKNDFAKTEQLPQLFENNCGSKMTNGHHHSLPIFLTHSSAKTAYFM